MTSKISIPDQMQGSTSLNGQLIASAQNQKKTQQ